MEKQRQAVGLAKGGKPHQKRHRLTGVSVTPVAPTLAEVGIGKNLAKEARKFAKVPDEEIERRVEMVPGEQRKPVPRKINVFFGYGTERGAGRSRACCAAPKPAALGRRTVVTPPIASAPLARGCPKEAGLEEQFRLLRPSHCEIGCVKSDRSLDGKGQTKRHHVGRHSIIVGGSAGEVELSFQRVASGLQRLMRR